MSRKLFSIAAGFTALAAALASPAAGETFAIRDVRVFDGEAVLPKATVVVEGGRIAAVGPEVSVPEGAEVVDGAGKTLLPGLIDSHTHAFGDALARALQFGVTTELDMFTEHRLAAAMRAEQAAGEAAGRADLFSAGILVTVPGGHGTEYGMAIPTLEKPEEAVAFVAARLAEGSDYIKLVVDDGATYGLSMPTLTRETAAAVIAAAHAHGKLAVVHISSRADAEAMLEEGADGLVHLFSDREPGEGFGRLAASKGAFVIPTLSVIESTTGVASGASLAEDPGLEPYLTATEKAGLASSFPSLPGNKARLDHAFAAVRRLAAAGAPVLAGTDAPNPGTAHGVSMHRELELLVEAGLTPVQALAAATAAPAAAFGLEDRGRIAPGLRADLLLVEGDPTASIAATRAIVSIWKQGAAVERRKAEAPAAAPKGPEDGRVSDFDGGGLETSLGGSWMPSTDDFMGGASTVELAVVEGGPAEEGSEGGVEEADAGGKALSIRGEIRAGFAFPWSGAMFFPSATPMAPVDFSGKKEIVFWARGDGRTYRVLLFASRFGARPQEVPFDAGETWKRHALAFEDFGTDGSDLQAVLFAAGSPVGSFSLEIDLVELR